MTTKTRKPAVNLNPAGQTCACGELAAFVLGLADPEAGTALCKPHFMDKLNERRAIADASAKWHAAWAQGQR